MMKDMLHKKKFSNKIQKGNTKTTQKIVVNFFFISFFIFFVVVCVCYLLQSSARRLSSTTSPTFGGAKQMAAARQETDYDFIHKISKTLLPLILSSCCWMHIQSIQYNMVEFLPYIFQCLYTLATFDVGWAAAVAKPKPHPPSITLLCPYVCQTLLAAELD